MFPKSLNSNKEGPWPIVEQDNVKVLGSGVGSVIKRWLPVGGIIAIGLLIYLSGGIEYLSIETLAENREVLRSFINQNFFLALAVYMLIYVLVVAISIPGGVFLTLTGGFLFGWFAGGIATVVGATIGATIIFLVARTALGEALAAKAGPKLSALQKGFQEDALSYLFFLRLVPLFPFWLVNIAPALLGVKLSTFVFATFFGIVPGSFAFSFAGVGLDSVIEAQQKSYNDCLKARAAGGADACEFVFDPNALVTKEIIFAIAALGIVALIPVLLKRLQWLR